MLAHQLPALPPIGSFWSALGEFFAWLTQERPIQSIRPQVPAPPDTYPVVGDLRRQGFDSFEIGILETIRFAATNRLCIDLDYLTLGGVRSSRRIEPYSLRRTSEGNVILHAIRAEIGGSRSYRVDQIQGAAVSEKAFTPRYTVEFTTFGPLGIPESSPRQSIKQYSEPSFKSALPRSGQASSQPATYIYECTWCGKRFRRKTQNPESKPHKGPDGWSCPGRYSYLIDVKY